jgi:hypothetical protein
MRNYCTIFFSQVDVVDNAMVTTTYRFIGVTFEQAEAVGVFWQAALNNPPNETATYVGTQQIYALLNRELLIGYFQNLGAQPNSTGQMLWDSITGYATAVGVDFTTSPKEQRVRPWNGRTGH